MSNPSYVITKRASLAALCVAALISVTGCATTSGAESKQGTSDTYSPLSIAQIRDQLAGGVPQGTIKASIELKGAQAPTASDLDLLKQAGATNDLIDTLLKANQPNRYVWMSPSRASFYFGRQGYYWVDAFGWPVYPQPIFAYPIFPDSYWPPQHHGRPAPPVKPSPKTQERVTK
jgi:hypothetical protein